MSNRKTPWYKSTKTVTVRDLVEMGKGLMKEGDDPYYIWFNWGIAILLMCVCETPINEVASYLGIGLKEVNQIPPRDQNN